MLKYHHEPKPYFIGQGYLNNLQVHRHELVDLLFSKFNYMFNKQFEYSI